MATRRVAFTKSGTWKAPPGVNLAQVWAWAGGGGGGASKASNPLHCDAGGGGAGGFVRGSIPVLPGAKYVVTVGTGGATGSSAGTGPQLAGRPGGTTSLTDGTNQMLAATGGGGGLGGDNQAGFGGAGGAGFEPPINGFVAVGQPGTTGGSLTGCTQGNPQGGSAFVDPAEPPPAGTASGGKGGMGGKPGASGNPGYLVITW